MKPFTFYDIYYVPIKEMDDRQAGKFFRMICDFLDGKQVTIDAESDEEISPEFELYWESILSDLETYPIATPRARAAGWISGTSTFRFCPSIVKRLPI